MNPTTTPRLTQDQIDQFTKDGFLAYGPLLDEAALRLLRVEYDRVIEEARQQSTGRPLLGTDANGKVVAAEKQQVYQVMQVCERSLAFRKLLYHETILNVVSELMGPNIILFHDQALFKPAHTGGPVPWHQDNAYWHCRPANLVSCWITLDDVTRENGAMQFVPGSHLRPVWHNDAATQKDRNALLEIANPDDRQVVVVDLPAGGCLFHHCQTLHYTQPNATDRQRRAYAIHYMVPGTCSPHFNGVVGWSHPMLRAAI